MYKGCLCVRDNDTKHQKMMEKREKNKKSSVKHRSNRKKEDKIRKIARIDKQDGNVSVSKSKLLSNLSSLMRTHIHFRTKKCHSLKSHLELYNIM